MSESLLAPTPDRFDVDAWGLEFCVYGNAEPGGSKRAGMAKSGRIFVRDDNPKTQPWKLRIAQVAGELMQGREMFKGPLFLKATFYRVRPASHFNKSGVSRSAPKHPTTRPDTTKLLRPVEDALQGIVYADDAQIVEQLVRKRYGEPARVEIKIGVLM
jgi:Holliday junction resolvase RusA-like endonuclease